jgi:hypothetical protein
VIHTARQDLYIQRNTVEYVVCSIIPATLLSLSVRDSLKEWVEVIAIVEDIVLLNRVSHSSREAIRRETPFVERGWRPSVEGGSRLFVEGGSRPFVDGGGRPFVEGGRRPFVKRGHSSREAVRQEPFVYRGRSSTEAVRLERLFSKRGGCSSRVVERGGSLREEAVLRGETVLERGRRSLREGGSRSVEGGSHSSGGGDCS